MDDSTGKRKVFGMRARNDMLVALFVVGLCLGIIISERVYISSNKEDILHGTALPNKPKSSKQHQNEQQAQVKFSRSDLASSRGDASSAAAAEPVIVYPKTQQMKELEAYLLKIAPDKEVLIGVSNVNPLREGMLDTFLSGVKQAKILNYLVVALDKETEEDLQSRDTNVFYMPIEISKAQEDTGANHAVSALKFGIIKKFLQLGWSVLLSDIDICVLQNPFKFLYRWEAERAATEAMPVGWDQTLALV